MKHALLLAIGLLVSQAGATYYLTIASDAAAHVAHLSSVSGGTSQSSGYYRVTISGNVERQHFGSTYYTWNRQNTTGVTVVGWRVIVGAVDQEPVSGIPSYYSNPGQVVWGNHDGPADDIPGGQG